MKCDCGAWDNPDRFGDNMHMSNCSVFSGNKINIVQEPSAEMRAAAKQIRGMFVALTNEGFTEVQAIKILGYTLNAALGNKESE